MNEVTSEFLQFKKYPKMECISVGMCFGEFFFRSLFLFFFLLPVIIMVYAAISLGGDLEGILMVAFISTMWTVAAVALSFNKIQQIYGYFIVLFRGEKLQGVVLGYDEQKEKVCDVRFGARTSFRVYYSFCYVSFELEEGKKMIRYAIHTGNRPYQVGEPVEILRHKKFFYVIKE